MDLICQSEAISNLKIASEQPIHSVIIDGPPGSGKSYLAQQYAHMVGVPDVQYISPKVSDIRDAIKFSTDVTTPILMVIENLDLGVAAAAYALLKILEEPRPNVFLVVTCNNINAIPDTIISRSHRVTISSPAPQDIETFAKFIDSSRYITVSNTDIWACIRTFKDIPIVMNMTLQQSDHFADVLKTLNSKDSLYNTMWGFMKYPDESPVPVELLIRYIVHKNKGDRSVRNSAERALYDIGLGRVAQRAIVNKFILDYKYRLN